jgi:hypothetical protein
MNPSNCNRPQRIEDRTVSRRSEPSSRTTLIGEQPNPWDLLQPQDVMCQTAPSLWTLGRDQPVIPSVPFVLWAMAIPRSTTGSLEPAFASARLVGLTVKLSYTHVLNSPITDRAEKTFVILRYHLGGFRPRKTDLLSMSFSSIRARS